MVKQTFLNLPEEKRQRIIDFAIEEFASKSYNKASLSNIVSRADIAKGSMYQYFNDKKSLYLYLIELASNQKLAYINKYVDFNGDFFTIIEHSILAGTRFGVEHPWLSRIVASVMEPGEELFEELNTNGKRMTLDFFEKLIQHAQEKGHIRKDMNARVIANFIYSLIKSGFLEFILEELDITMKDFLQNSQQYNSVINEKVNDMTQELLKFLRTGLEVKE